MKTILGIDPGSQITGFGVIKSDGRQLQYVTSGYIKLGKINFALRLQKIFQQLSEVINAFTPNEVAIEQIFMHANANAALKLGQARGVAMVAAALHHITIVEYSALQIKKAVVGYGVADKHQVQHMVKVLLKLSGEIQPDAADALAIAICHAHFNMQP